MRQLQSAVAMIVWAIDQVPEGRPVPVACDSIELNSVTGRIKWNGNLAVQHYTIFLYTHHINAMKILTTITLERDVRAALELAAACQDREMVMAIGYCGSN